MLCQDHSYTGGLELCPAPQYQTKGCNHRCHRLNKSWRVMSNTLISVVIFTVICCVQAREIVNRHTNDKGAGCSTPVCALYNKIQCMKQTHFSTENLMHSAMHSVRNGIFGPTVGRCATHRSLTACRATPPESEWYEQPGSVLLLGVPQNATPDLDQAAPQCTPQL